MFSVNAEEVVYAKKLQNWTTKGNFEGILKNYKPKRGIEYIGLNDGRSIWVGTYYKYTNNEGHNFHKGYWKHSYNDKSYDLAHYVEYDTTSGATIRDDDISIEEFNLAIKYIKLDLKLPFDFSKSYSNNKTQIAKAKPNEMKTIGNSQVEKLSTDYQKLKFCVDDRVKNTYSPYINTSNSECGGYTKQTNFAKYIEWKFRWNFERINDFKKTEKELFQIVKDNLFSESERYGLNKSELEKFIANSKYSKFETQIAKAELSQTQEQSKETNVKLAMTAKVYDDQYFDSGQHTTAFNFSHKAKLKLNDKKALNQLYKYVFNNTIDRCKLLNKTFTTGICTVTSIRFTDLNNPKNNKSIVNKKGFKKTALFFDILNSDNTKIAGAEPTITTKKKVKVAKVEEPKQEEFKPENKDIDNDAPVIEIAENITVNDTSYIIEGKVTDKSKKLFVQIDGETIPVNKGKFKIKRFSPVDEQLKIIALDQWGNKSKPKIVKITIDLKETELADKLEQLNPSLIKSKSNKNRVALIIGIEKYEQTPAANFANLDAQYFYEYARKGFGISKSNIKLLVDEDANLVKSISSINKWLPSKIKKNKTELIIFFAGHGLASNNGEELYILPQDSDPDLLSRTALSRTELFEQIITLSPKSVTMFMDTCYSGISRDEKMLLASARPIRIVADDQEGIPNNFTIFTASKLDQISSGLEEAKHGIFSYYLMKGLEGEADSNHDKKITNGELLAYMDENVSQKAAELGREQNPSLAGDPNKVLIRYR
tara:strand:- start:666 stop:2966 length:2301 start_codon:yes stop_codon:yes gene_type:complete